MQQSVIPQLRITDAERSLQFYVSRLGFTIDWEQAFRFLQGSRGKAKQYS